MKLYRVRGCRGRRVGPEGPALARESQELQGTTGPLPLDTNRLCFQPQDQ